MSARRSEERCTRRAGGRRRRPRRCEPRVGARRCRWALAAGTALVLFLPARSQSYDSQLYERADALRNEGRTDAAVAAFREVLSYYPDYHRAWEALGRLYLERGQFCSSRCAFDRALRHNPRWPRAYRGLAESHEKLGQTDSAVVQLKRCLPFVTGAEHRAVRDAIARLERVGDESDAGSAAIDSVVPVPSRTPQIEALFQKAVEHYKERRFRESLNTIHEVLSRQPDHGGAYYYGGLIRRRWGEDRLAEINFVKGLAYPELGYNAHFYLGKIHGEAQEYEPAIRHLRAYVRRSTYQAGLEEAEMLVRTYRAAMGDSVSGNDETHSAAEESGSQPCKRCAVPEAAMARYLTPSLHDTVSVELPAADHALDLLRQGEFAQAAGLLEEWLLGTTDTASVPLVLFNLGVCRIREGAYEDGLDYLCQFIARVKQHPPARRARFLAAVARHELGLHEEAELELRRLAGPRASEPWVWKALEILGDCRTELGQTGPAIKAYRRAISRAPTEEDAVLARYKLGLCLLHARRLRPALAAFKEVLKRSGEGVRPIRTPSALLRIADVYFAQALYADALQYYREAVQRYPDYFERPWAVYQIAAVHTRRGEKAKVRAALTMLQEEHADDYWARQAAWRWPSLR